MKQIMQDLAKGGTELVEAPAPQCSAGHLLIDTVNSLISTGTERMLVDFGKSGLLAKARSQPEKVVQVLEKTKTDGVMVAWEAVRSKMAQPIALGYCNVGVVRESQADGFQAGDRVASSSPHADVVSAPRNLCAKIPDNVSDEAASFTVVASIGLQGIRLAKPTIGECFVVIGVGLIGLLTVQLLRTHGCRVLAIDYDDTKLQIAKSFGAEICNLSSGENSIAVGMTFSRGAGVDGVIITASTKSSTPVAQAARMCRKRGRIILVGVTGLELNRSDFYEKELTFQVSCSYGPGRYDPSYEDQGQDYPLGFVRWTEQRNFLAILDLMANDQLDVTPLITHRASFEQAPSAYDTLTTDKSALGILLIYDHALELRHIPSIPLNSRGVEARGKSILGFVGAGNYASRVLIPAFRSAGATLHTISSFGGTNAALHGRRAKFGYATSDTDSLFSSEDINTVAIATRHDSHADFTVKALNAGKHVFVEKPLALSLEELSRVQAAHEVSACHLMVGFNRRYSPLVQTMRRLLSTITEPKSFIMVMNAGAVPASHWTQNPLLGGGRIIGEACHYIDLMRYLAAAPITSVQALRMGCNNGVQVTEDKATITLGFADGSFGTIHYLANGGSAFPKERIEVFAANSTLKLDNFSDLRGFNWGGFSRQKLWRQDKGQSQCVKAFLTAVETGSAAPIPTEEIFEVTRIAIEVANILRSQENSEVPTTSQLLTKRLQ